MVITIEPPPEVSVVALEDQPPAGWLVREISDGGAWDKTHGKVKWGPYFAPSIPSQVSYELLPPAGETGEHCFIGTISFDGDNQPISGDACLQVGTSGDHDYDGDLDLFDFAGFQLCFGESPIPPGCAVFDFDFDDDIDLDDFELWSLAMTGPGE